MKTKLLSLALALCMAVAPMTVSASNNHEISTTQTVTAEVSTKSGTGDETGSDGSTFIVAIPQEIELSRSTYITFAGDYQVGVKAVLAPGDKVTVTPAATFDMTDGGENAYTANVTQEVTKWIVEGGTPSDGSEMVVAVDDYAFTTGNISVDIKKTGEYTGDLGFTVDLVKAQP